MSNPDRETQYTGMKAGNRNIGPVQVYEQESFP